MVAATVVPPDLADRMPKRATLVPALLALVALALSVPLTWFTFEGAPLALDESVTLSEDVFAAAEPALALEDLGALSELTSLPSTRTFVATGVNGTLNMIGELPIWFVVLVGALGVLVGALNRADVVRVPTLVPALLVAFAGVHVVAGVLVGLLADEAVLGSGGIVAAVGLLVGIGLVFPPRVRVAESG